MVVSEDQSGTSCRRSSAAGPSPGTMRACRPTALPVCGGRRDARFCSPASLLGRGPDDARAAQEAGDTAMQGYVLLKKSQMAYDLREAHRVVTFAEAAQHGRWQFPRKVRAEVTQQQAFGLAMTGESLSKVEQKLD